MGKCIVIVFFKVSKHNMENLIKIFFRVFVDDEIYGEICSNTHSNKNGYQFLLTDLSLHQPYKVFVKVAVLDCSFVFLKQTVYEV